MLKYIFGILALCGALMSCSGPNIRPEEKVSKWELDSQFGWFFASKSSDDKRAPGSIPENITFKSVQKFEILDLTLSLLRQTKASNFENPLVMFNLSQFSFLPELSEVFEKTEARLGQWNKSQKFSGLYLAAVKAKAGDRKPSSVIDLHQEALQMLSNDVFDFLNAELQLVEGKDWSEFYYFVAKKGCQSPCALSVLKVMQRPWFNKTKFAQSGLAAANGFELTGVYTLVRKDFRIKEGSSPSGDFSEVQVDSDVFLSKYEQIDQKILVFISKK